MDCRGYRPYMWPYLRNELGEKKISDLIDHVDSCQECRNELKMQFLISEGFRRLEEGSSNYNLLNDFDVRLDESRMRCKNIKVSNMIVFWGSLSLVAFCILILVTSLFI